VAAHAVHNFGVSITSVTALGFGLSLIGDAGGVLLVALIIWLAGRQELRWLRSELADEVGRLLTAEEYQALQSTRGRWQMLAAARKVGGLSAMRVAARFQEVATELAFRKRRFRAFGAGNGLAEEIRRLGEGLVDARARLGWSGVGTPPAAQPTG
jgi:hypothetical protein